MNCKRKVLSFFIIISQFLTITVSEGAGFQFIMLSQFFITSPLQLPETLHTKVICPCFFGESTGVRTGPSVSVQAPA